MSRQSNSPIPATTPLAKMRAVATAKTEIVTPDHLRQIMLAARERIKQLDEATFAQIVIDQISPRFNLERKAGRQHAVLMSVRYNDLEPGGGRLVMGRAEPEWLRGAARMVWEHCKHHSQKYSPECQPVLETWQDGDQGVLGGVNILIRFQGKANLPKQLLRSVLNQIPVRAELEAKVGRDHAVLMSIPKSDINRKSPGYSPVEIKPEWLLGTSRQVFDECTKRGFKPTLEQWENIEAGTAGFNLVLHW